MTVKKFYVLNLMTVNKYSKLNLLIPNHKFRSNIPYTSFLITYL